MDCKLNYISSCKHKYKFCRVQALEGLSDHALLLDSSVFSNGPLFKLFVGLKTRLSSDYPIELPTEAVSLRTQSSARLAVFSQLVFPLFTMRWRVRCPLPHCSEEISQDSDNLLSPESKEKIWLTLRNAYGKHFAAVHASEFPMEKYPEAIPDIELKVDNGTIFKSVDQGRGRPDTKEATATMLGNCKRIKHTQPDRAWQCGVPLINQVKGPESFPVSAPSNRRPGQGGSHSSSFEEDDDPLSTFFAPSSSRKPPVETREEEKKSVPQSMEQATSAHHQRLQQMDQFFKKAEGPSTPPVSRADLVKCSSGSRMGIESKRREPAVETEEIESPVETPKKKGQKRTVFARF